MNCQQRVASLDRNQRILIGAVGALVVAGLVAALMFSRQPDYRVLFSNLSDKDGGAIVTQLAAMNVPYKYTEGGGSIMIPADRVHDVRLKLATQGPAALIRPLARICWRPWGPSTSTSQ